EQTKSPHRDLHHPYFILLMFNRHPRANKICPSTDSPNSLLHLRKRKFEVRERMFLYPPSQDSVVQVTAQAYTSCNLKDPILYMNNGNSLFNFTSLGNFYFTSGEPGRCQKNQKLHISFGNGSAYSPSYGPSALPDSAPSYPTVFGTIQHPLLLHHHKRREDKITWVSMSKVQGQPDRTLPGDRGGEKL
ncbi:early nodulin-like protein 8, partial [Prunus dulcis]